MVASRTRVSDQRGDVRGRVDVWSPSKLPAGIQSAEATGLQGPWFWNFEVVIVKQAMARACSDTSDTKKVSNA